MNTKTLLTHSLRHAAPLLAVSVLVPMLGCGQFSFSNSATLQKAKKAAVVLQSLKITSVSNTLDLGVLTSANPITITTMGSNNLPMAVSNANGLTVTITGITSANANLFLLKSDGTCGNALLGSTVTIPNGYDHFGLCVQPTVAPPSTGVSGVLPTLTVQASASGLTAGSLALSIRPIPFRLNFVTPLTQVDIGVCSAGIPIVVQDYQGATIPAGVSFSTITATLTGAAGIAHLAADCSDSAISSPLHLTNPITMIYLAPQTLTQVVLGLTQITGGLSTAAKNLTVNSIPGELFFSTKPSSVSLGILSSATQIRVRDIAHNPVNVGAGGMTITLQVTSGQADLFTSTAVNAPTINSVTVSPNNGLSQQFYIKPRATGTLIIHAFATYSPSPLGQVPAGQIVSVPDLNYSPGQTVASITVTTAAGATTDTVTGGIASAAYTISLKDGNGNPFCPASPLNITVTPTAGLNAQICNAVKCPPASRFNPLSFQTTGATSYQFYVYSDLATSVNGEAANVAVTDPNNVLPEVDGAISLNGVRTPLIGDSMFKTNGQLTIPFDTIVGAKVKAAALAANHEIVAAGYKGDEASPTVALAKFFGTNSATPSVLDPSFNGGIYTFGLTLASYSYVVGVIPQQVSGNERYLLGIQARTSNDFDFALARVCASHQDTACPGNNTASLLDPNFTPTNTTGHNVYVFPGNQMLRAALVSPSTGKVYLVGTTDANLGNGNARTDTDVIVVAFKMGPSAADVGQIDTSFGTNGYVQLDLGSNTVDEVYSANIFRGSDNAERINIAASSSSATANSLVMARLKMDGSLDTGFNTTGKVSISFGAEAAQPAALLMQGTSTVVAINHITPAIQGEIILMRFRENGTRDTNLAGGNQSLLTPPANQRHTVTGLAANPADNEIYLAGYTGGPNSDDESSFLAWRLSPTNLAPDVAGSNLNVYNFGNVVSNHAYGLLMDDRKPLLFGQASLNGVLNFALQSLLR